MVIYRPSFYRIVPSVLIIGVSIWAYVTQVEKLWALPSVEALGAIAVLGLFSVIGYIHVVLLLIWPIALEGDKNAIILKYLLRSRRKVLYSEIHGYIETGTLSYYYVANAEVLILKSGAAIILSEDLMRRSGTLDLKRKGIQFMGRTKPFLPGFKKKFS